MKRRNVVKVAVAYAIVAWLLIEVSSVMGPALRLPEWAMSLVAFLLILGIPVAMVLSWAYELTPGGVKLEKDVDRSQSSTTVSGRNLDFFIIGALALALVFVVIDQYVLDAPAPTADVSENLRSIAVLPFDNRTAEGASMFIEWAAATGRNVETAEKIANNFIQFQQTGEPVTLSAELLVQLQLGDNQLIWVYGFVGDKEKTIELLQRQYRQRAASQNLLDIKVYAFYDFIRDDPRFVELLEQIGLVD